MFKDISDKFPRTVYFNLNLIRLFINQKPFPKEINLKLILGCSEDHLLTKNIDNMVNKIKYFDRDYTRRYRGMDIDVYHKRINNSYCDIYNPYIIITISLYGILITEHALHNRSYSVLEKSLKLSQQQFISDIFINPHICYPEYFISDSKFWFEVGSIVNKKSS